MGKLKSRKKPVILIIIALFVVAVVVFAKLVFWNSSYSSPKYRFSADLLTKVLKAQESGGTAELSKDEVNGVISLYFKQYKTSDLVVKSVEADFKDDKMVFFAPVTYKNFNLLLSSQGDVSFEKGKIIYNPEYFKLGKIALPKSYVLKKLQPKLKNGMALEGDSITISTSGLPISIKNINVKDQKLLVTLEKKQLNIEDMLKGKISSSLQNFIKNFSNVKNLDPSTKTNNGNTDTKIKDSSDQSSSSNTGSSKTPVSQERQQALNRLSGGLNAASGAVSTGGQKAVISQMASIVNNMKDSSYNPYSAEGSVRAAYNKLSSQEKAELKAAIGSNVDSSAVSILSSMIGN
ncbi:hypothetical protein [Clostridium coskatii]|uniref:DUF2140 domain-containing protein n=1 Tax=Clostridium coskatii TaxID=1705578 RepID=A0A162LCN4_9CLOT|nr:hypothetical protein [Clostridium coskatii]OAA94182.1 hypothetical protein WX73_03329 [Clostridium coskatii]OBR95548.1 hypothetical protein CLCOS_13410 [Clostridium coskatii]